MSAVVPITPCAQCPKCKIYIPISPEQLANLTTGSTVGYVPTYQPTAPVIQSRNPVITLNQPVENLPVYQYSEHENSWRSKFWAMPVLIHGIVELVLTVVIIILEIASLGISTYDITGAGIWCSLSFMSAAISTILLVKKWDRARFWATRVLISQIALIVFSFILIGIDGSFVSSNKSINSAYTSLNSYTTSYGNNFTTKYQIMQAQLAMAVLLLFAGIAYVVFYCVVTYLALWKPYNTLDTPHLFRE